MMSSLRFVVFSLALLGQIGGACAQTAPATSGAGPSTDPASTPDLQLSTAQKQTIYTSIRNLNVKNESVQDFQPLVGAIVPAGIELQPMPQTLGELTPQVKRFEVAVISGRVVIVEPKGRRVVDVIAGDGN